MECKFTKQEIRDFSKELGLDTWNKPSYACLLTRIPYGNEFKEEVFIKIEKAEKYIIDRGVRAVRVRCHDNLPRIEVNKNDINRVINEKILEGISNKLKELGFQYVTLDLEGYRTGSFNEMLENL